jgi:HAD superfamily phosphatase (TIGR01668 family)
MIFRPTYLIDGDVTDIDLDLLERDGLKGLIFDLDSTLIAPHSATLTQDVEQWLSNARERFKTAVVSNNNRDPYMETVRKLLDMHCIGAARKPSTQAFREVLRIFDLPPYQVAVIGDRPLTDVWGGQRAGMKTILVLPLKTMNEPSWVRMFRRLERVIIKS